MFSLNGKSALITGASRGIGLEIARTYRNAGAHVTLVSRNAQSLTEAASSIPEAAFVAGDVTDPAVVSDAVEIAMRKTGRLDILVNNAGGPPPDAPLVTMPMADFDATIAFNLRAPLLWAREAWQKSMRTHGGVILNIASIGGISFPRGMGAYATAKAGLLHMTKMLAAELGPKVRVNAIAPGVVKTQATAAVDYDAFARILPLGRVGEPTDVAGAALFLVSDAAAWITAETITIDGGTLVQTARLKSGWDKT